MLFSLWLEYLLLQVYSLNMAFTYCAVNRQRKIEQKSLSMMKRREFALIKNIIFDVGDVLLGYQWKKVLMEYGLPEIEALKIGGLMFDHPLWNELDLGRMSTEEIIVEYLKDYPEEAEHIAWLLRHSDKLPVPRPLVWEQVDRLKDKGYKLYVLSNYSEELFTIHTKSVPFLKQMDGIVVSYQVQMTKPDDRIFKYLLEKYDLRAEECVFFDDKEANTATANELGIKAITIVSEEHLIQTLQRNLNEL